MGNPNWIKGAASPNPSGKTLQARMGRVTVQRKIALLTHDGEDLVKRLVKISEQSRDTPERARLAFAATLELMDRFYGKAPTSIEHTGTVSHEHTLLGGVNMERIDAMPDDEADALEAQLAGLLESGDDGPEPAAIDAISVERDDDNEDA